MLGDYDPHIINLSIGQIGNGGPEKAAQPQKDPRFPTNQCTGSNMCRAKGWERIMCCSDLAKL